MPQTDLFTGICSTSRRHVQPGTREFRRGAVAHGRARVRLGQGVRPVFGDKRAAEKIRHTFADLIGQRIFGIACGHPDGNDADHLADDPIHKLLLGRDPVSGAALGVSRRYDLAVRERREPHRALPRWGASWRRASSSGIGARRARAGAARHHRSGSGRPDARRPALTFFNGHYGRLVLSAAARVSELRPRGGAVSVRGGADGPATQWPPTGPSMAAVSTAPAAAGGVSAGAVSRSARRGLCDPEINDFLDAEPRLDYVVAMAKNAVLQRHAESAMQVARAQSEVGARDRARLYATPATPAARGTTSAGS